MIGIILAGGTGSRLWPITRAVSKQLLPVYNKPMIYYPLSTLMLAGIKEIVVITTPADKSSFELLLGDGSQWGIDLTFEVQDSPRGLAEAFLITEKRITGKKTALILGDNLFHGAGTGAQTQKYFDIQGAQIFAYAVSDPENYGVVEFDPKGFVISIEEKPVNPKSAYAVPGLYFYDEKVLEYAKLVTPSARGELEISSINQMYLESNSLKVEVMSRGTVWLDTGSFDSLSEATSYVQTIEKRQGRLIACPEEIAYRYGWISKESLISQSHTYKDAHFRKYLLDIAEENIELEWSQK